MNIPPAQYVIPAKYEIPTNILEKEMDSVAIKIPKQAKKSRSKMGLRFSIKQQSHSKVYKWPTLAIMRSYILSDLLCITGGQSHLVSLFPTACFTSEDTQNWLCRVIPHLPDLAYYWTTLDLWNEVRQNKCMLISKDDVKKFLFRTFCFFVKYLEWKSGNNASENTPLSPPLSARFNLELLPWTDRLDSICKTDCSSINSEITDLFMAISGASSVEPLVNLDIKAGQDCSWGHQYPFYLANFEEICKRDSFC